MYSVNINVFQGPFDLLFHLIEKGEIDIYDIPIAEITDQYLEYLEQMMQFNMNVASEFILMASTLMEIKSEMLLPQKEKEDPRQELVTKLLEYKLFKDISEKLREYEDESSYYFSKPKEEIALTSDVQTEQLSLGEINVYELYNIYLSLLKKQNFKIEKEEKFKVYRETYRVKDCMDEIIKRIRKLGKVSLFNTFKEKGKISKEYAITFFLALLELANKQEMKIYQYHAYSDIIITG
ncbi:MAG TPA: segregation/condensation protein A [Tissierellia bacterium]|nr:segregation/condensation protein A [Tissierellia bacterium]